MYQIFFGIACCMFVAAYYETLLNQKSGNKVVYKFIDGRFISCRGTVLLV